MGSASEGILFFGVKVIEDEDGNFPFADADGNVDDDMWFRLAAGFEHKMECPFDDFVNWKNGFSANSPNTAAYYKEQEDWDEQHENPYEIISLGYYDEPSYAIALKSTIKRAEWDECVLIKRSDIQDLMEEVITIKEFCEKNGVTMDGDVGWFMSSYYG